MEFEIISDPRYRTGSAVELRAKVSDMVELRRRDRIRARAGFLPLLLVVLSLVGCRRASVTSPTAPVAAPASNALNLDMVVISAGSSRSSIGPGPDTSETIRFRDVTAGTGIRFVNFSGYDDRKWFPANFGSGVAMLDYDGDGWLDLYFITPRNLPFTAPNLSPGNRLYRNRRDGTFEDVTDRAGVGFRGFCHGVTVGDINNDGHADIFLTNFGPNVLYLNNGDGTFRDATAGSGLDAIPWSCGAAMLDYDGDGKLDLYVTCYSTWTMETDTPCYGDKERGVRVYCSPYSQTPVRHYLFRNRGDGTFEDVTQAAGILRVDGRGLGVIAADVNLDGWTDLYVANDGCPKFLFLNRGDGTFEDVSEESGAGFDARGGVQGSMGVDVEDVDGDGLPELLVTNFRGQYDTLYHNIDGRHFEDVTARAGIVEDTRPWVSWGCALADFDNDTFPDMLIVNGEVDDNLERLGQNVGFAQPAYVWRNQGKGTFRRVRSAGSFFNELHTARGAAFGDLNNDGKLDVVVVRLDRPPAILLNESDAGRWVRLELVGHRSNRSGIGAVVSVHLGDRILTRQVKGGGSYLSANDPRLLIGLGTVDHADRIEVRWPSGARSTLLAPESGRTHRVDEPSDPPPTVPGQGGREERSK
jgi:hypothetical protein